MTADEIRELVEEAAKLRVPAPPNPDRPESIVIDELSDYMLTAAQMRGALAEARMHAAGAVEALEDQWDAIEGWEAVAGGSRVTEPQRDAAKATLKPDVWQGLKDGKRLLRRIDGQMGRLCGMADDEVASRVYSLLAG